MNRRFIFIEILFLIIPLAIAWINTTYSSLVTFSWGYDHVDEISTIALFLGILGNFYIYWLNKKSLISNKIWAFLSIFLVIILITILYIGKSLSNFGF